MSRGRAAARARHRAPVRAAALLATALAAACDSGGDEPVASTEPGAGGSTTAAASSSTAPAGGRTTTTGAASALPVEPGRAVVVAGEERLEFVVFQCLVGEETGSPSRRLALSAGNRESFEASDLFLDVDILVSTRFAGHEEHVIEIFGFGDEPDLGAADVATPSRGGPAPDDWIVVDEAAGEVRGSGFELRTVEPGGRTLPAGTLAADCP